MLNYVIIENEEKYSNVLHQNDVWHGGKNITKKINAVSSIFGIQICNDSVILCIYNIFHQILLNASLGSKS